MKKELKDYLHLYLGCDCMVESRLIVVLCGFQQDGHNVYKPVIRAKDYSFFHGNRTVNEWHLIKPILRPLSDMTEEEVIPRCENCNTEMKRVYHAPPVKFNGTGFYSTGG